MDDEMLASECSSGCESGWTLYLEQSFLSPNHSHRDNDFAYSEEKGPVKVEDEEEDLSMVSDASSGPPIFHKDQYFDNAGNGCFCQAPIDATLKKNNGKKKRNREINRRKKGQDHASLLDDTASSPIFNFSQNNRIFTNNQASMEETVLDYSEGCSTTHLEGRSAFHEPFGFFQSSISGTQIHQNQWFGGKMGMR